MPLDFKMYRWEKFEQILCIRHIYDDISRVLPCYDACMYGQKCLIDWITKEIKNFLIIYFLLFPLGFTSTLNKKSYKNFWRDKETKDV